MRTRVTAAFMIAGGLLLGACGASPAATGPAVATASGPLPSASASTPGGAGNTVIERELVGQLGR